MKPVKWEMQGGLSVEIQATGIYISDHEDSIVIDEFEASEGPSLHNVIDGLMAINDAMGYDIPNSIERLIRDMQIPNKGTPK